jgi:hypothetical protein
MRTRTFQWLFLLGVSALVVAACSRRSQGDAFRPTATIKDLMDAEVDKSADTLWDSVATIVSKEGTEEKQPRTDEEWANVRHAAITLVEATNLLVMDGRKVAKPGERAENPDVELGPEEIEKVLNDDRAAWVNFAHGLQDAAMKALKATDAKNAQELSDAGEGIDEACEMCHLKYWYPNSKQAAEIKKKQS